MAGRPLSPRSPGLFDALRRPDEGLGGRIARNPALPLRVRLGGDPVQFLRVLPTGDLSHGPGLRALGVDADGLYDTVYPDAAGQLEDSPYRILLVVVYDLGSLRAKTCPAPILKALVMAN